MKDIDFLPAKYRDQHVQRKNQLWRVAVVAAFVVLAAAGSYALHAKRTRIEVRLQEATVRYEASLRRADKMVQLAIRLGELRADADLITYLRHPWPRTQILAAVLEPLPASISLSELQVDYSNGAETRSSRARSSRRPGGREQEDEEKLLPAQRDLRRLREEKDASRCVVALHGAAREQADLHAYLGKLGLSEMFEKVELLDIETSEETPGVFRFSVKLTVRSGYGQPGGPGSRAPLKSIRPEGDAVADMASGSWGSPRGDATIAVERTDETRTIAVDGTRGERR